VKSSDEMALSLQMADWAHLVRLLERGQCDDPVASMLLVIKIRERLTQQLRKDLKEGKHR